MRVSLFGFVFVATASIAHDWYWDWLMDNHDRHYDILSFRIVRRRDQPGILLGVLGPILLGFSVTTSARLLEKNDTTTTDT